MVLVVPVMLERAPPKKPCWRIVITMKKTMVRVKFLLSIVEILTSVLLCDTNLSRCVFQTY